MQVTAQLSAQSVSLPMYVPDRSLRCSAVDRGGSRSRAGEMLVRPRCSEWSGIIMRLSGTRLSEPFSISAYLVMMWVVTGTR